MRDQFELTPEQIERIQESMREISDILQRIWEAIIEAARAFMEELRRLFEPELRLIGEWWARLLLTKRLESWHIPHWLAYRIAKYMPRRFLAVIV